MSLTASVSTVFSSFTLIALAELGDKSQLVCMTLAARHRRWPVLLGASLAFALLNVLAVVFGAGMAAWIPDHFVAAAVALLFLGFGIHALRGSKEEAEECLVPAPGQGIFVATLVLIFLAELGDKTQIAVAGLAGALPPLLVWLGATAALVFVSAIGVWVGGVWLQRLPLHWVHRFGGVVFLIFALFAGWRAVAGFMKV